MIAPRQSRLNDIPCRTERGLSADPCLAAKQSGLIINGQAGSIN